MHLRNRALYQSHDKSLLSLVLVAIFLPLFFAREIKVTIKTTLLEFKFQPAHFSRSFGNELVDLINKEFNEM